MPYIQLQTNQKVEQKDELVAELSRLAAEATHKPESYVMASVCDGITLTFAGSGEPAAFVQFKSIGLPESETKAISASVCGFLEKKLGISSGRIYIEFASAKGSLWGWSGGTF